jgi:transcription-repair coupling factor (superfamily II helicase)
VGIIKIDAHTEAANLQFMPKPPIDPMRIIELIQKNRQIKLNGQDKLKITAAMPDLAGARAADQGRHQAADRLTNHLPALYP